MPEIAQYLLVVVAVAVGWGMGRWSRRGTDSRKAEGNTPAEYYQGLRFLLNDKPDAAIDAFINSLEVNTETLETHLAVGSLLRKKGEVDRAIRVHQNLLARPSLPVNYLNQVQMELARDYIAAGLLDRAERILHDLLAQAPELRATSLQYLLEIYQDEKEWDRAITVAKELVPKKPWLRNATLEENGISRDIAHFYCELAERAIREGDYPLARSSLRHAIQHDRGCVRASILMGQLELEAKNPRLAIKAFRRVFYQDPAYMAEILDMLRLAHEQLGSEPDYVSYLMSCYEQTPSTAILLALVEAIRQSNGERQAEDYFADKLKSRPTLRGLAQLINLHSRRASQQAKGNLQILQGLIGQLLTMKPAYQCQHCGFSGQSLHWQCPSCKQWGRIAPIRGAEGD